MKINLTQSDWVEIWNAVQSKKTSPAVDGDKRWIKQLDNILKKLGPDGERAFKYGVVSKHDNWWTAVILYPDYAVDNYGQDTFTGSARGSITSAIDLIKSAAIRHIERQMEHDDLFVINVFKGKLDGRKLTLMKELERRKS